MKIRENMKMRRNSKRFVCIALIMGMMLSLSSSYVKAEETDGSAQAHVQSGEILEKQYACELEEHEEHEAACYAEDGNCAVF